MKERIIVITLILVLIPFGLLADPAAPKAEVSLVASIGEIPANSGIRVVEGNGVTGIIEASTFDPIFFSAPSVIQMATGVDTAQQAATGNFTILVRRPTVSSFSVTVEGTPLELSTGGKFIAYTIKEDSTPYISMPKKSEPFDLTAPGVASQKIYTGTSSSSSILRHQKTLTYNIPKDAGSPLGIYSADLTMTLTTL